MLVLSYARRSGINNLSAFRLFVDHALIYENPDERPSA